ncbi:hypothetical protein Dimus_038484 [Dionaea muscipula]
MHHGHETVDLLSPVRLKKIFRPAVHAWDEGRPLEAMEESILINQQVLGLRGVEKAEARLPVCVSKKERERASLSQAELTCCKIGRVSLGPGLGIRPQNEVKGELLARQKVRPSWGRRGKKKVGVLRSRERKK